MTSAAQDTELKQRHRKMWASGDYPSMVETFLLPLGPRLVEAAGSDRHEGPRRRRRHRQRLDRRRRERREVTASDLTPELFEAGRKRAEARASSWSGWRPTPRTCRSRTGPSTSSCRRSARCSLLSTGKSATKWSGFVAQAARWDPELDPRGHDRCPVQDHGTVRAAAPARRPAAAAVGKRGPYPGAVRRPRRLATLEREDLEITAFEKPRDYGEHFKAKYGPTIVARANAEKDGRDEELDQALATSATSGTSAPPTTPASRRSTWSRSAPGLRTNARLCLGRGLRVGSRKDVIAAGRWPPASTASSVRRTRRTPIERIGCALRQARAIGPISRRRPPELDAGIGVIDAEQS